MIATKAPNSDRSLAAALGVTAPTIATWRDKFSETYPRNFDPIEWQAFVTENGLGTAGNRVSEDREHWLTKQAESRAKLLEIEHRKALGEIVMKSELDERDMRIASRQKAALYDALTGELPVRCEGKSAAEIRVMNRDAADRICVIMQQGLADWAAAEVEE